MISGSAVGSAKPEWSQSARSKTGDPSRTRTCSARRHPQRDQGQVAAARYRKLYATIS